ncbi:MAG: type I methionyl aminopeptidase [Sulfurimonas sp. RIFOXYD12_FULL_33_39]|uniref:type I methionyl aminopeptidase n=1 Tax=unclassified Sulfurimonas TaxID=2623549 RepID=UPI0008C46FED|nr:MULTISPECIES: type I methionyl aminopeptidase [unclassified Sulfurimonas]OHE07541.1 MAG: type I methionyl aminopeptidase [Sulfurimonas sp. RIFCSPLOWO2_12_FULL_34_6]OHE10381.1 MAG: type I methionyl aminopeptidase [Sulfurimonas sp. RIFOXYD12_FULL_33_39]OHE14513.1 MAG: type I methionyl aminopeptidase [Sulfurimonas sp. RIFOXYD2_FULL_34_21]
MAIALRQPAEIEKLRIANKIVGGALELLKQNTKVGISLKELDAMAEEYILSHGAKPSFKGLYGFPNTVCTSLNQVIIHGIPTDYRLQEGDIIGYDIGTEADGWFGDAAITVPVGKVTAKDEELIACARESLYEAIESIKVGMRFKELSEVLEKSIRKKGFVPLHSFCGHGIGKKPHEEPEIPNYLDGKSSKAGPKIKNGMVFCIEPMICQKDSKPLILENKWDVVSADGLRGSHYEHTVAIVNGKAEILSLA